MRCSLAKYLLLFSLAVLADGCSKESGKEDNPILFRIKGDPGVEKTKSAITDETLTSTSNTVKVYAEKDAKALTNMGPATLTKGSVFWEATPSALWEDGHSYTFQGYAYTNSGISVTDNRGIKFTVTQPSGYSNPAAMADFVFADKVNVTTLANTPYPVVTLDFYHVLPALEVYVTCPQAMVGRVSVSELDLSGLYYAADMVYSETDNDWMPSISDLRTADYTVSSMNVGNTRNSTDARMSIISVPQNFTSNSRLTVTYRVDESMDPGNPQYQNYTQTFILGEFVEGIWGGERTVFHLDIDTGIRLHASIIPWRNVDFIEGTVLPPIDVDE